MLQYAVIAGLIQFALHLVQFLDFAIGKSSPHHNTASSMLCGWCNIGGSRSFTNTSLHIDPLIWPRDFELWFVSPKDIILLLYCSVFEWFGPLDLSKIVSFPQQWFLNSILLYRPASQSLLLTVDVDTFFHDIGLLVQWCLEQSAFCHASWCLWWNFSLLLLLLVYHPYTWTYFVLFPDVS